MPLGYLKVSHTVPRRYGHHACAEVHVDCLVFNDGRGNLAVDPFNLEFLAVSILSVSRISRVHHDILVAKLRFGTRGSYDERPIL